MRSVSTPARVVPLQAAPHGPSTLYVSLARLRSLLLSGLSAADRRLLLGLGATSTIELHALSRRGRLGPEGSRTLRQLASAAEAIALTGPARAVLAVEGVGMLAEQIRTVLRPYAESLVSTDDAPGPAAALPAVAVCASVEAVDVVQAQAWRAAGVPVLPVVHRGEQVMIGPMLRPAGRPCAQCLELYRADRDPGHRFLTASALTTALRGEPDTALATLAAGVTAMIVRSELAGSPGPEGIALGVAVPNPTVTHHRWSAHPRCLCATLGS